MFAQNKKLMELNKKLEERAEDAGAGLNSWQMLLETLRVGVVAIDENGLVVAANRRGMELTLQRVGLLCSGDIKASTNELIASRDDESFIVTSPEVRDLMLFALSDAHLELRMTLGVAR